MAGPEGNEAGRVSIRVLPNTADFRPALKKFLERVAVREVLSIRTEANVEGLARDVVRGIRAAEAAAKQVTVPTGADARGLVRDVQRAAAVAEKSASISLPVGVGALGGIAKAVGFAVLAAGLVSTAASAVQLLHALAPVAGALAAYPALIAGVIAANLTLKLGLVGVSDALKGDAEAMAKLTPSARAFVAQVNALKPAFDGLRRAVQEQLFAGLSAELSSIAGVWLPRLQAQLPAIAAGFNDLAKGVAAGATSSGFLAGIDAALTHTAGGLSGLATGAAPLLDGLGRVIGAFAPFLSAAGEAAGGLAAQFGAFIAHAEATGQLAAFVESVTSALSTLGSILGNVAGIVGAIFSATASTGGGLLGTIEQITGAVSVFLNSAEGQTALSTLFSSLQSVVSALLPVILILAEGVGTVLAPALATVASALGPALEVLGGALVDALSKIDIGPLAEALASVVTAAAPLLPVIGTLANLLAGVLAGGLGAVAALLEPLANALNDALTPEVVDSLSSAFGSLGEAAGQIASQAAPLLVSILDALLPTFLELVPTLIDSLVPAALATAQAVLSILEAVTPILPPIVQLIGLIVPLIAQLASLSLIIQADAIKWIGVLLGLLVDLVAWLLDGLVAGISSAIDWLSNIGTWFEWLGDKAGAAIGWIADKWRAGLAFFRSLPGKIMSFLTSLPGKLVQLGKDMISGVLRGLRNLGGKIGDLLLDFAYDAWESVKSFFGVASPSKLFQSLGEYIGAGWVRGLAKIRTPVVRQSVSVAKAAYEPWTANQPTPDTAGAYGRDVHAGATRPVVTVDGTGLPRALAEWLRYAVRTQGGGSVQAAFGTV